MEVDDSFYRVSIFVFRYFLCTICFFIMISLTIYVYDFLNIDIAFPVRNGFQQDIISSSDVMRLSKTAKVLNILWGNFNFCVV